MTILRSILQFLVFGNIFIAVCALMLGVSAFVMFQVPFCNQWPLLGVLFCSTLLIYSFHAHITFNPANSKSPRLQWIGKSLRLFKYLGIFSLIGIFLLVPSLPNIQIHFLLIAALTSAFYTLKISIKGKPLSLRTIPFAKALLITIAWVFITTILPFTEEEWSRFQTKEILEIISRFFLIFALAIGFDMRDKSADEFKNVKTLPVVFGIRGAKAIALAMLVLALVFFGVNKNAAGILVIPAAFLFVQKSVDMNDDWKYSVFGDGVLLLYAILLISFY